ncbi:hypothetical protein KMC60_gp60 [Achromobacter phage vB_AxyP_19-32_Axy11]|uniref:Transmembrane protein n=1 Tax=Achromobacter phage vB_AxyP_19-32_Axy11 TaxID=2591042 RepID=A0A514CUC6_9CAUD|nr:hypothetical protein KMC60_gp60 [Achromobacter phage vB_AxyP_19-32_Axy11]QDH84069.1 hypothetical protein Axy11_055 [Achromobacter phage vB_AxyP_19-32_Axy11]
MTAGKLLAYLVIAFMMYLLLTSWVHASAPYIAIALIAVFVWKVILPRETGRPDEDTPDKQ